MFNRSQSITGILIAIIGFLGTYFGVPFVETELDNFIRTSGKILELIGLIWAYAGRYRKGDITAFGSYR